SPRYRGNRLQATGYSQTRTPHRVYFERGSFDLTYGLRAQYIRSTNVLRIASSIEHTLERASRVIAVMCVLCALCRQLSGLPSRSEDVSTDLAGRPDEQGQDRGERNERQQQREDREQDRAGGFDGAHDGIAEARRRYARFRAHDGRAAFRRACDASAGDDRN